MISKKWALVVIGTISNHKKIRFNELKDNLIKISPKALADRLKDLEKAGLIKKEIFPEIPPRVEYSLTKDGNDVRDAMIPLLEWVKKKTLQEN